MHRICWGFRAITLGIAVATTLATLMQGPVSGEKKKNMSKQIDHESAKESIRHTDWDCVATFGATFSDENGTGACDVSVMVGEASGTWYLRTQDNAGGSDDCDAAPYADRVAAVAAAVDYAKDRDECDGQDAATWLERQAGDQIAAGKRSDGEYVLAHKEGTRWDGDRYSDKAAAEAAIKSWYDGVQAANPGTNIIWHLMDCPELGRLTDAGEIEMVSAENE